MSRVPTIRRVLALLYEVGSEGVTAWECTERLDVKYNSAAIALARLAREGWCKTEHDKVIERTGRPCKRYTIKEVKS